MWCYFIRGGQIADVDQLTELSDEEAIAKAHALFSERKNVFEGFELWDGARVLTGHPRIFSEKQPTVWTPLR